MRDLIKKFEELKGLELKKDGRVFVIGGVSLSGVKIILRTSWKTFVMHESEAIEFLSEFDSVDRDGPRVEYAESSLVSIQNKEIVTEFKQNSDKVTNVLLGMIDKIGSDEFVSPDVLNKAKAVCQIANTLVGIERVKQGYIALSKR